MALMQLKQDGKQNAAAPALGISIRPKSCMEILCTYDGCVPAIAICAAINPKP